jgi:hypothetical protein
MSASARPAAMRRQTPFTLLAVAIVIAATGAVVAVRSSASAQAPGTHTVTFSELDKGSTFKQIRNTKTKSQRTNSLGDMLVFANPIADTAGRRVGKLHVSCTTTVGSRVFTTSTLTCLAVAALGDGTITITALTKPGATTTSGAVTGGTGAYAGARGAFVSHSTKTGADDTVTLLP